MRAPPLAALLAVAAVGCSAPRPHGLIRVDLAGPEAGPGSADELHLSRVVNGSAEGLGLACQPGGGALLLHCSAAAVGNQGRTVTITLTRSGTGYEVGIDQAFLLPGRESPVCGIQRHLADTIDAELARPAARVDRRSGCPSGPDQP